MDTIYRYRNDYDPSQVCEKLTEISDKIDEEKEKGNSREVNRLMYAQFLQGLRLSTGGRYS